MNVQDKELIESKFEGLIHLMNAQFTNVNERLDSIDKRVAIQNGRVTKNETRINEVEKRELVYYKDCPHTDAIRTLEDSQLTQKSIRKWIVGSVGIATGVISALWLLFQIANL
jgi:hypothetical protein